MNDAERQGLVRVADVLETQGRHGNTGSRMVLRNKEPVPLLFNLGTKAQAYHCGTIACIGGWLSFHLQGLDVSAEQRFTQRQINVVEKYVDSFAPADQRATGNPGRRSKEPMAELFWPSEKNDAGETLVDYNAVKPEQAAKAIRNFLEHGDPRWSEV